MISSLPRLFSHMTVRSVNMAAASDSPQSSVRKRRVDSRKTETESAVSGGANEANTDKDTEKEKEKTFASLQSGSYWLTRIVLLRSVAFIYCEFLLHIHKSIEQSSYHFIS